MRRLAQRFSVRAWAQMGHPWRSQVGKRAQSQGWSFWSRVGRTISWPPDSPIHNSSWPCRPEPHQISKTPQNRVKSRTLVLHFVSSTGLKALAFDSSFSPNRQEMTFLPQVHSGQRWPRGPRFQGRSETLALSGIRISRPALLAG